MKNNQYALILGLLFGILSQTSHFPMFSKIFAILGMTFVLISIFKKDK